MSSDPVMTQCLRATNLAARTGRSHTSKVLAICWGEFRSTKWSACKFGSENVTERTAYVQLRFQALHFKPYLCPQDIAHQTSTSILEVFQGSQHKHTPVTRNSKYGRCHCRAMRASSLPSGADPRFSRDPNATTTSSGRPTAKAWRKFWCKQLGILVEN